MQSRKMTVIEVVSNTFVGMAGSWVLTWLTFKSVNNLEAATTLTVVWCTIWSLVRGYAIRRTFGKLE